MTETISETNATDLSELEDDNVAFYAEGHTNEEKARAEDCRHLLFTWTLEDEETNEWRKECCFCPAVLEQEFSESYPRTTNRTNE